MFKIILIKEKKNNQVLFYCLYFSIILLIMLGVYDLTMNESSLIKSSFSNIYNSLK